MFICHSSDYLLLILCSRDHYISRSPERAEASLFDENWLSKESPGDLITYVLFLGGIMCATKILFSPIDERDRKSSRRGSKKDFIIEKKTTDRERGVYIYMRHRGAETINDRYCYKYDYCRTDYF